jgi:hypothetical protein
MLLWPIKHFHLVFSLHLFISSSVHLFICSSLHLFICSSPYLLIPSWLQSPIPREGQDTRFRASPSSCISTHWINKRLIRPLISFWVLLQYWPAIITYLQSFLYVLPSLHPFSSAKMDTCLYATCTRRSPSQNVACWYAPSWNLPRHSLALHNVWVSSRSSLISRYLRF